MGRPRKKTPRYLAHKQSGRGRAVWTDDAGKQCEQLLPGAYESAESRSAYARFLLEHEVAPKGSAIERRDGLLLVEALEAYHRHAEQHYRGPDLKPTSELAEVRLVVRALREMYGQEPAADFGPLKLKAVRQGWVLAKLSRNEVNRRTNIVRRVFKWLAGEELVTASVYQSLTVVSGLQRGRTTAREPEPIGPVDDATVDATLPFLGRHVRGLIEFMRHTGCRPGEACALRGADIDRTGDVWLFRPRHHKTAHKGKARVIAIGPRAQAVIEPFLGDDPNAHLFNPATAVAEARAERAASRKTPRFPSHMARNKSKRKKLPKRAPSSAYSAHAVSVAVSRACALAFPPPGELAMRKGETRAKWLARLTPGQREQLDAWNDEHRWHPNQLRHSFATKVRRMPGGGLEAAQVLLGHAKADVTQIYAEKNEALAVAVAAKVG